MTVPPSLQCETATPLKLPTSPSVSWPRWCWNRRLSWLGGLPSLLHSHCVSLESASVTPVYTQKNKPPFDLQLSGTAGSDWPGNENCKVRESQFQKWHHKLHQIKIKNKRLHQWISVTPCTLCIHFNVSLKTMFFQKTKLGISFGIVKYLTYCM